MARLGGRDYEAVLDFTHRLYSFTRADTFAQRLCRALPALVGAEQTSWNAFAFSLPRAEVHAYPELADPAGDIRRFNEHLVEHPAIRNYLVTGNPEPFAISDFVSRREFHRLPIYEHLYRPQGHEDQMGFCLTPPAGESFAVALARDRRSFTERDRAVLAAVRPHVARAWDNARAFDRARRALVSGDAGRCSFGVCLIELDVDGRPVDLSKRAGEWLYRHFRHRTARELPSPLRDWLQDGHKRGRRRVGDGIFTHDALGCRLLVRHLPEVGPGGGAGVLLLEERMGLIGSARTVLRQAGLSDRQVDVLAEVERGKSNDEVAATLCISPATVKKHLEHIFDRLHVSNRTAAVACARSLIDAGESD